MKEHLTRTEPTRKEEKTSTEGVTCREVALVFPDGTERKVCLAEVPGYEGEYVHIKKYSELVIVPS